MGGEGHRQENRRERVDVWGSGGGKGEERRISRSMRMTIRTIANKRRKV